MSTESAKRTGRLVGVIATRAALAEATRLQNPPDFFELRLDALSHDLGEVERALPTLGAPLILTARHPLEGGYHSLGTAERRGLLLRFLDHAALVDVELRSLGELRGLWRQPRRAKFGLIISTHELDDIPPLHQLQLKLQTAKDTGADIFKVVLRTDTRAQLDRLIEFFETNFDRLPIAAMGIGKLGAESRQRLAQLGSALLYASIGEPTAEGQPSL